MSRSVIIRMRRRAPGERIEPFRRRKQELDGEDLRGRLIEWATSIRHEVADAWPKMPDGVEDRPADVWEPLLAIADAAGGLWPDTARSACVELCKLAESRDASLGVRLLTDVRAVLIAEGTDRLSTETLLAKLCAMAEAPWADLRGKHLDARSLGRRLGMYDVHSHQFKVAGEKVRGYSIPGSDEHGGGLYDAFARYLPHPLDPECGTGGTSGTSQISATEGVPLGAAGTGTRAPAGTAHRAVTSGVPQVPHPGGRACECGTPIAAHHVRCAPCAAAIQDKARTT